MRPAVIELFQFQRDASTQVADRFIAYLDDPVVVGTRKNPRRIPFFQALSSLTASGKTVILADATAQLAATMPVAPVILWLSKATVVVEQSYANLIPGGKYHHLISDFDVHTLAEYSATEVEETKKPIVYFATVGTFNQKDKEKGDRLIFRSEIDKAGDTSTWTMLKRREDANGSQRPLVIVYDEAHNLSDQQTDLLLELDPEGLLLATATMRRPGRLEQITDTLKSNGYTEEDLTTNVSPKAVADSGLVKNTVLLGGYRAPMEETIDTMLEDMAEAQADALVYGLPGSPKAIYVCNTNMVATDSFRRDDPKRPFEHREAPPILIWRYLTETHGIDPAKIATYASLKFDRDYPPPADFVLYSGGDSDYAKFTQGDYEHIIFNLSLQEGWDDPLAYFAYVDRSMESRVQIEQVIGRLLRQPEATHRPAERLNTAHFYIRVDKNETFNEVLEEVSERLNQEAPSIRVITTKPGKLRPREYAPKGHHEVPATAYDSKDAINPIEGLLKSLSDYRDSDTNTTGVGSRRISKQKVGSDTKSISAWEEFRQSSRVSARWVFQREVKRLFVKALEVASTADNKFDAQVGLGSNAHQHITDVAHKVVDTYLKSVVLVQRKPDPYVVGPGLAREEDIERFDNAIHEGYDGLNSLEREFAQHIDKTGLVWCRNPARTGYGIPLISIGTTSKFYPDFLIWNDDEVIAVDTKGEHLLLEAAGRKLLHVRAHKQVPITLQIRFVSKGKFNEHVQQESRDGFTLWSRREDGTLRAEHHEDMATAVKALLT
jgi:type III restriction enzyme